MSAIRVIESTGSLGTLQVSDGFGGFHSGSLVAGTNVTIANNGTGSFTINAAAGAGGSTIGEAEDGDYTDGLFVDFENTTEIGTAIDRFNEILKALAPSPAPNLDDINTSDEGIDARLSFGSSNDQASASPAYFSVAADAGIGSSVDSGAEYLRSGDKRIGIFTSLRDINGNLNEDVVYNSQGGGYKNFPARSFGNGEQGTIFLDVNGVTIASASLTDTSVGSGNAGSGTDDGNVNVNGSGFLNLSAKTDGTFSNGNTFSTFKHRTGEYIVKAADQRQGWNYARIRHVIGTTSTNTNYIEWVNDTSSDSITASGNSVSFTGSGSIHLSGVEYFQSGTVTYKVRVNNAYKYIYRNSDTIIFNETSTPNLSDYSFTNLTKADHSFGSGDTQDKILHITASDTIAPATFINGTVGSSISVTHPNTDKNLSSGGSSSATGILIFDQTTASTNTVENFNFETHRIVSGTYDIQDDVRHENNVWNSTVFITASNGGHSNGLQFFNSELRAPRNTTNSGDFRDDSDGGSLNNAPSNNPDYSGQTSGQRTFYRWFQNKDGVTHHDLSITINGTSTIVANTSALDASKIRVFVKVPGVTGWMDAARQFVLDAYQDNDGAHIDNEYLNFDNSLNATNYLNFGNVGVADDDYVVLRIEADSSWTGDISQINVNIGAGTGTLQPVPNLNNINVDQVGVTAKLSFDDTKTIPEYSAVTTTAGFSDIDLNEVYEAPSGDTDYRRGVFDATSDITGFLNNTATSALKSYEAKAFADANSGSLKLEVNGNVIHQIEITGSYNLVGSGIPGVDSPSGNSLNRVGGSGFTNLSFWEPGKFETNGVPSFSEIYRLSKFKIDTDDQREGWNYARVIHTIEGSNRETNYVEWVNDISGSNNDISFTNLEAKKFNDDNIFHLSGVKYFISPSGSFGVTANKIYTNVYSHENDALSITDHNGITSSTCTDLIQQGEGVNNTSNGSSGNTASLASLVNSVDTEKQLLHVTASCNVSHTKSLRGTFVAGSDADKSVSLKFKFKHPLKNTSGESSSLVTATNFLIYTSSDDSSHTSENFTGEQYRIISGTYGTESSTTDSANTWNSTYSINDNTYASHENGLMIFDGKLISPFSGGESGNFRNKYEASSPGPFEGPDDNVDYSTLSEDVREYFRYFTNPTTADLSIINVALFGDAELKSSNSSLGIYGALGINKNIYMDIKVPGQSQFMDCARQYAGGAGQTEGREGDGCRRGTLTSTIDGSGASNQLDFDAASVKGTASGGGPDPIIVRIRAHKNWTGYISQIQVTWSS